LFLHSFLNKEALISKSVAPEVQKVLDEMVKMVNNIKSTPLQSRLFSAVFCHGSCYTHLLLHMELRWLSLRWLLSRFYELREELITFSHLTSHELANLLSEETWYNKVAFIADNSQASNTQEYAGKE
jgi:hypothetical protein